MSLLKVWGSTLLAFAVGAVIGLVTFYSLLGVVTVVWTVIVMILS